MNQAYLINLVYLIPRDALLYFPVFILTEGQRPGKEKIECEQVENK